MFLIKAKYQKSLCETIFNILQVNASNKPLSFLFSKQLLITAVPLHADTVDVKIKWAATVVSVMRDIVAPGATQVNVRF